MLHYVIVSDDEISLPVTSDDWVTTGESEVVKETEIPGIEREQQSI